MRLETHFHTYPASACAYASPRDMIAAARERGLDAVCVTDHNRLAGYLDLAVFGHDGDGPLLIPAIECTVKDFTRGVTADVLFLADDPDVLGHMDTGGRPLMSVDDLLPPFPRERYFAIWAHPTEDRAPDGTLLPGVLDLLDIVDAVELRNGKRGPMDLISPAIFAAARARGLLETGGSDAHAAEQVGIAVTVLPGTASTPAGVIALLRSSVPRIELRDPDEPRMPEGVHIQFVD